MRDDFPASVRRTLGQRVGYLCSHPECGVSTIGPGSGAGDVVTVGVAAHIAAASPGGPRFDPAMTAADRADIRNGIWLCQTHAREIDAALHAYSVEILRSWKQRAEAEARRLRGSVGSFAASAQAPVHTPHLPLSRRTLLSFASRSTPFLGRERELAALSAFLEGDEPFSWTCVSGPAGSGKSRLLLEFSLAARPAWLGGFVDTMRSKFDWKQWSPTERNLIIVDYASTFPEQVRDMFAAFEKKAGSAAKMRVILLDRSGVETFARQVFPGSDGERLLGYFDGSPIELEPFSQEQVGTLVAAILGTSTDSPEVLYDQLPAESRFPLYAAILAQLREEGVAPDALDRTSLVSRWLNRERSKYWSPAGVTKSEIRLACLTSIGGPMEAETALSGDLATCGIDIDAIESQRYEALTGITPLNRFDPLTPDILGEYLVLQILLEQNPANALSKALLQRAWVNSPQSAAGFLKRVSEDFPRHPAVIKVVAFVPMDVAADARPPRPGRPTLPTMWAETIPSSAVAPLYRHHGAAIFDAILAACGVRLDHEVMPDLRRQLGDQLFDDPECLNNLIILSSMNPYVWDYTDAHMLALRLSDIRWNLAHLIKDLLGNLTGFKDDILDKIVTASGLLLQGAREDRRVRSVVFAGLMDGMSDRYAANDPVRGRLLWDQMAETFRWWLDNPNKRAMPHTGFPHEGAVGPDLQAEPTDIKLYEGPGGLPTVDPMVMGRSYSVYASGEDQEDKLFIDGFGKGASNYVLFELRGNSGPDGLASANVALNLVAEACSALGGKNALIGRLVEAIAYWVQYEVRNGDLESADTLIGQARSIISDCRGVGAEASPGIAFIQIQRVTGFLAAGDLDATEQALIAASAEIGIPNSVAPTEFKPVGALLASLSAANGGRGDFDRMLRFSGELDDVAACSPGAASALLEMQIAARRNAMVTFLRAGRQGELVGILSSVVPLVDAVRTPQQASYALQTAEMALASGPPFSEALGQSVVSIFAGVCECARRMQFGELHSVILDRGRAFIANSCARSTLGRGYHRRSGSALRDRSVRQWGRGGGRAAAGPDARLGQGERTVKLISPLPTVSIPDRS